MRDCRDELDVLDQLHASASDRLEAGDVRARLAVEAVEQIIADRIEDEIAEQAGYGSRIAMRVIRRS